MEEIIDGIRSNWEIMFLLRMIPRLTVTAILCGLIGVEREHVNRPAGLRTHVLVGISAALVMITSEYLFHQYYEMANMDPARLGAQVISGIGFLGAGTIVKDGFSVRGLTTAASLWAVACIGLAAGAGLYSGAILATIFIYVTLQLMKNIMGKQKYYKVLRVRILKIDETIEKIKIELEKSHIYINQTELFMLEENMSEIRMKISISSEKSMLSSAMEAIRNMENVSYVDIE